MLSQHPPREGDGQLRFPPSLESLSSAAVDRCKFGPGFVRPAYESYCFSNLPGFFEHTLLGSTKLGNLPKEVLSKIGSYDHIVFVFIDAFGWESFQRFRSASPFLQEIDRNGIVVKTTSQFPSTTASHVTTAYTGLPVYEHEVCGFDYFEPRLGRMIRPLRFGFTGEGENTLRGHSAETFLPKSVTIPRLRENNVTLTYHGPDAFFPSDYNTSLAPAEFMRGYPKGNLEVGVKNVVSNLQLKHPKTFQSLYIDKYDATCHKHKIGSFEADRAAIEVLEQLERFLLPRRLPRTLLVISADHGQLADRHDGAISLQKTIPNVTDYLKLDACGKPIRFSGGIRHLFLHPRPECESFLLSELRTKLAGVATVMTIPELSAAGLLGPTPVKDSLVERLGTIGIIPHAGYSVFWDEPPLFFYGDKSHHGGPSPQEMETPLLFLPIE